MASPLKPSEQRQTRCCYSTNYRGPRNGVGRNLAVCIDGTSNRFGQSTNVVQLFAAIDLEKDKPEQHAYYVSGVGTRPKPLHVLKNRKKRTLVDKIDMAIGWNVERLVIDAYAWLARTYRDGDNIYLFGFSRGAFQVRLLAAMIHDVGLIRAVTDEQIGAAFDHYDSIRSKEPNAKHHAQEFRDTFSWRHLKRVHFVGVWDTVSSVGFIKKDVFLSHSSCAAHACYFRHALALDERRVKFIPEYFQEINSELDPKSQNEKSDKTGPQSNSKDAPLGNPEDSSPGSSTNSPSKKANIKEVWFAGSHSDVGGTKRLGRSYRAGNVSLLWMRREADSAGLVLKPTDIVWVPDDLALGTSDSMNFLWRIVEYLPIRHQTCFSGVGENTRRTHQLQPRRVLPGQKVHVSILFGKAYIPQASIGAGLEVPIIDGEPEDANLTDEFWENGLFDASAASEILNYLHRYQEAAPVYLDRLLFMLRFEEGRECIRKIEDWTHRLEVLMENKTPLARLVALVAYHEVSGDPQKGPEIFCSEATFKDARDRLKELFHEPKHRDGPRVVALLRSFTRHQILQDGILIDLLDSLGELLDKILKRPTNRHFGPAMDTLTCLLRCERTQPAIIKMLTAPLSAPYYYKGSRLSWILKIDLKDQHHSTAALRMTLALAQIPTMSPAKAKEMIPPQKKTYNPLKLILRALGMGKPTKDTEEVKRAKQVLKLWSEVKPQLRRLAASHNRLVGSLAVEVFFALYVERDRLPNLLSSRVGINVAGALISLKPQNVEPIDGQPRDEDLDGKDRAEDSDGGRQSADPEERMLSVLFGFRTERLRKDQKWHIGALQQAIMYGNASERTVGTLTLVKLCHTPCIRRYLDRLGFFKILIDHLQLKESALLAAHALTHCLAYRGVKDAIEKNELLPKYIVGMLQLDYFDDAVGKKAGFDIFDDLMKYEFLREKIKSYKITKLLEMKLTRGDPTETRTSLICLGIFLKYDRDGPWASDLVKNSLEYLGSPEWQKQKGGVMILSALAQTEYGTEAIKGSIQEIIGLLPDGKRSAKGGTCSWMMGPACALRILAQNGILREQARKAQEYHELKNWYLTGTLSTDDTSPLLIRTPNRGDVVDMLDKMIKTIDGELFEARLMSLGDMALPHIEHVDRLGGLFWNWIGGMIVIPVVVTFTALGSVLAPIYVVRPLGRLKLLLDRQHNGRIMRQLRPRRPNPASNGNADAGSL